MISYDSAVSSMYALGHELANTPSHKFDLAHMRALLAELGNPQTKFPAVLIAGTNGKGSTAATLASILRAAGYSTGLYTSPHLMRLNERIRIHGEEVGDDTFAAAHAKVDAAAERLVANGELPWHPSFFEMMTAIAFEHFAAQSVDIAVLEVGMGGRLDATNVVEPLISVIADIALDHQQYLGNTLTEIAREKCGIIRQGGVVVTLPQIPAANDVIGNTILERGARGVSAVQYVPPVSPNAGQVWDRVGDGTRAGAEEQTPSYCYPLPWQGAQIMVETPLIGRHQLRNVALALGAADELTRMGFTVSPAQVEQGIRQTIWPGRFQWVRGADIGRPNVSLKNSGAAFNVEELLPDFLFDVAHNPAGAWALRAALTERFEDRPFTLIFGAMRDKAIGEMAEILFPIAERILVTSADNPRSATGEEIRAAAGRLAEGVETVDSVGAAIRAATVPSTAGGLVVITGSIYIVGEALRVLNVRI